ncbi:hypothetical protein ACNKHK_23295 [Shigella flexneri]
MGHAIWRPYHVERKGPDPEIAALAERITQLEKRLDGEKKTDNSTLPEI